MAYPLRDDLQEREDAHQTYFKGPHMVYYHLRGDLCKKGKTQRSLCVRAHNVATRQRQDKGGLCEPNVNIHRTGWVDPSQEHNLHKKHETTNTGQNRRHEA